MVNMPNNFPNEVMHRIKLISNRDLFCIMGDIHVDENPIYFLTSADLSQVPEVIFSQYVISLKVIPHTFSIGA